VLELEGALEATSVCFYDVFFLEKDLSNVEQEAYKVKVDEDFHARAKKLPSILELEVRCPHCHDNAPSGDFSGSIRQAVCPRCHKSFAPQPGHMVQALYARAGLNNAE
jgi:formylmethanofuran dehydrogenase subunit E